MFLIHTIPIKKISPKYLILELPMPHALLYKLREPRMYVRCCVCIYAAPHIYVYQRDLLSEGVKFKLNNTESYVSKIINLLVTRENMRLRYLLPILLLRSCFVSTHKYPDRRSTFCFMINTLVFH